MSLAGIIGNGELIARLFAELTTRPSHTYLFAGPRGVGKALVALGVAHSLLCERAPGANFCCTVENCPVRAARPARSRGATAAPRCDCCAGCVQIASGVHPDFTYVARAANRTDVLIEQVRALIDTLGMKPLRGPRRVALIDDAETLNLPAQNALLKTLEEPPGHTLIILVCDNERAMLDTVRSRARVVRFAPLDTASIAAALAARMSLSAEQAEAIARLARGSLGRALEIAGGEPPPVRELLARLLEEILCFKLFQSGLAATGETAKLMTQLSDRLEPSVIAVLAERALRAHAAIDAMANSRLQAEAWWMAAGAALRGE